MKTKTRFFSRKKPKASGVSAAAAEPDMLTKSSEAVKLSLSRLKEPKKSGLFYENVFTSAPGHVNEVEKYVVLDYVDPFDILVRKAEITLEPIGIERESLVNRIFIEGHSKLFESVLEKSIHNGTLDVTRGSIVFGVLGRTMYVLDGQHRMRAMANLRKKFADLRVIATVVVFFADTETRLHEIYASYNCIAGEDMHVTEESIHYKQVLSVLEKKLVASFGKIAKRNPKSCKRPAFNLTSFIDTLVHDEMAEVFLDVLDRYTRRDAIELRGNILYTSVLKVNDEYIASERHAATESNVTFWMTENPGSGKDARRRTLEALKAIGKQSTPFVLGMFGSRLTTVAIKMARYIPGICEP